MRTKCHALQQSQSEAILKSQAAFQRSDQMASDFKFYNQQLEKAQIEEFKLKQRIDELS